MQDIRKAALAASLLSAIIAFLVYIPSFGNGFVAWDDPRYVYDNPGIRTLDLAFLKRAFTEVYFSNWHPLTMISYAVDHALWGLNPLGYHIENAALHAVNTALVALLSIRLITIAKPLGASAAFAAGLIPALAFGLHPLHVESVAWISERKDLLSGLFFIASMLFYLRYAVKQKALCYFFSLISFALAIMSKPMAVTLPAVLLLIDFYPLRKLSGMKEVLKAIAEKLPFFAISAFASIMALYAQGSTIAPLDAIPIDMRVATALKAYAFYLEKLFVPIGLAPFYPLPPKINPFGAGYIAIYALLGTITAVCLAAVRYRAFITAWLYFTGTLLPVIGFVQVGTQAAADRYMYLPSISLFVLLGAGAAFIIERNSKALTAGLAVFAAIAALGLSCATVSQAAIWKDSITLWNHGIGLYPEATIPYIGRGTAFLKIGENEKGLQDLDKAIALNPYSVNARHYRAHAFRAMGRYTEALADLDVVISLQPTAGFYNKRGDIKTSLGDLVDAVEDYRYSIQLEPMNAATHLNLAMLLEKTGDFEGAIASAGIAAQLGMPEAKEYLERLSSRR